MAAGFAGDGGPATSALLNASAGLAVDTSGNVYIADSANHRVSRIDVSGMIATVVGTGIAAYSGDGGAATAASLNTPAAIALDAAGNLYIGDTGNSRIRRADAATPVITTVAGTGSPAYNGDGTSAVTANLGLPIALQRRCRQFQCAWI